MGKRTLRTLHFEMVARVLKQHMPSKRDYADEAIVAQVTIENLAHSFADEFEIRAELFDRKKFLKSCGLEEGK